MKKSRPLSNLVIVSRERKFRGQVLNLWAKIGKQLEQEWSPKRINKNAK